MQRSRGPLTVQQEVLVCELVVKKMFCVPEGFLIPVGLTYWEPSPCYCFPLFFVLVLLSFISNTLGMSALL